MFTFPQSAIYFINLSHLVPEIFTFFKKHVENLNVLALKLFEMVLNSWDLIWP
jgi:hypothetical protein